MAKPFKTSSVFYDRSGHSHSPSGRGTTNRGRGSAASSHANDRRKPLDVCAVKESLARVTADVIICPIQGLLEYNLQHKHGQQNLAYQIIHKHPRIEEFIKVTKIRQGGLATGEVLLYKPQVSGGRSIIFATGPMERDYANIEECYTDLRCTFANCFKTVAGMNAKVLAVPAISAGNMENFIVIVTFLRLVLGFFSI